MKQVKLIAALLLFVFSVSAQTVTPDPGPYQPMNQKYEYRWIKTSGGIWNLGKFVQVDSAQFSGVTYVPTAPDNDSSLRVANTAWVKKNITAGSAGGIDSVRRKGVTDSIVEFYGGALGFRRFAFTAPLPGAFVPYTGATQDVNFGEFGLQTGNVEFDNTPTNLPTAPGSMYYNDTDGTLDLILKGGNVKLQIGQETVLRVVNKTATNINLLEANYQAVRVTGAQGQRVKVDLAQATSDTFSAETIGLVTETINNNEEGFITTSGLVRNINTTGSLQSETWADGDIVYLSPTTAGRITNIKPVAPNHLVIIGYVIHSHATQGSIFVKVDNGYELDELHNVKIVSPTNNQALLFNDTTDVWENKTLVTVSSYGKNAGGDSTILVLSNGTRYAAKDSIGGGGASQWVTNGSNIYYGTGKVGVTTASGTMTPKTLFHISDSVIMAASDTTLGLLIENKSLATVGVQRESMPLMFKSEGWGTFGTPSSRPTYARIYNSPEQGIEPVSKLNFDIKTGTSNFTNALSLSQFGALFNPGTIQSAASSLTLSTSGATDGLAGVIYGGGTNNSTVSKIFHTFNGAFQTATGSLSNTYFEVKPTINMSGAGSSYTGLRINSTETAVGSGQNYLFRAGKGGGSFASLFDITNTGQVVLGTTAPLASSKLQIESTTQGVLLPRMTLTQRNAIASPAAGLQVIVTGETGGEFVSMYNSSLAAWQRVNNWANNGSDIYYNTGKVGIGTNAPATNLTIQQGNQVYAPLDLVNFETALGISSNSSLISGLDFKNFNSGGQVRFMARNDVNDYLAFNAYGSTAFGTIFGINRNNTNLIFSQGSSDAIKKLTIGTINAGDLIFGTNNTERARFLSTGELGIGTTTPNASAKLDITSTTQGVLFPRMTTTQKNNISSPAAGLVVYDTTLNKLCVRTASTWETITSL